MAIEAQIGGLVDALHACGIDAELTTLAALTSASGSADGSYRLTDAHRRTVAGATVRGVTHDSRQVEPGSLFACLRGEQTDGHRYISAAVAAGAVCLLVERSSIDALAPAGSTPAVAAIVVESSRRSLGPLSATAFGSPSAQLLTFGITGTNGKTTTAAMLAAALMGAGHDVGVIGTLTGARTTPEAPELQARLAEFVAGGKTAAVMEVSSHALAMQRVDGTEFDVAVFTNLGSDHLDQHGTQEAYFRAKARLFEPGFAATAVINTGDEHGRRLSAELAEVRSTSLVEYSDADASNVTVEPARIGFDWRGRRIRVPIGGRFNVTNAVATMTAVAAAHVDIDRAAAGLATLPPVRGRFETIDIASGFASDITVVVDYAHTPEGLEHVLTSARLAAGRGAVHIVFGCGGDRDADKRGPMGAVAATHADRVTITSDNPRREDPMAIIDAVHAGAAGVGSNVTGRVPGIDTEVDRGAAIDAAVRGATAGDVVVVAGKGHERTQEFADRVVEFDDADVVRTALERRAAAARSPEPRIAPGDPR